MIIPQFNNGSDKTDVLVSLLQNEKEEHREAVYFGIAEAISSKLISMAVVDKNVILNRVEIESSLVKLIDAIGEIAIIERTKLEAIIRKVYRYNVTKSSLHERMGQAYTWTCLNDALGITTCYSTTEMFNINRHFKFYRDAMLTMIDMISNYPYFKKAFVKKG